MKLIATGLGEAPTAVNNALHYINPKERTQPGHSTSLYDKIFVLVDFLYLFAFQVKPESSFLHFFMFR